MKRVREALMNDGLGDARRERLERKELLLMEIIAADKKTIAAKEQSIAADKNAIAAKEQSITAKDQAIASEKHARVPKLQRAAPAQTLEPPPVSPPSVAPSGTSASTVDVEYADKFDDNVRLVFPAADDYMLAGPDGAARLLSVLVKELEVLCRNQNEKATQEDRSKSDYDPGHVCAQDRVHDFFSAYLRHQALDHLALAPPTKGSKERPPMATEPTLTSAVEGSTTLDGAAAKPDLVILFQGRPVATIEAKKHGSLSFASPVAATGTPSIWTFRAQAALNSFAVLNQNQALTEAPGVVVSGRQWMFYRAKRREDGCYSFSRTDSLEAEDDVTEIVNGLAWWLQGVQLNAAKTKESEVVVGGGGSGASSERKVSENENKGKGKGGLTVKMVRGQPDPSLKEKMALLNF
jgi:hypothetical protein